MKKTTLTFALFLSLFTSAVKAQENNTSESFGNTLNIGLGIGYYGYVGHTMPVIHADFEFNVARNFTLAPFITVYSYRHYHHWGSPNDPYQDYYYRQTVIPLGVKASYYFDQFLPVGSKWDFYLAASLGFAVRKTVWDDGYHGETNISHSSSGLYIDGHIGTEFHLTDNAGLYLDLSTGQSMIGVAFHF